MRNLRIRRLEESDLASRVEWLNDPSVSSQMVTDFPLSIADTRQWFRQNRLCSNRRDFSIELIGTDRPSPQLAAMGGLVDIDHIHRRAELYVVVKPGMTRQGIGRKVVEWLCNYGFVYLNLNKIYLYTMDHNEVAHRLYERLGFSQEGILREHTYHFGQFVDRYVFSLLREAWKTQTWKQYEPISLEVLI